MKRVSGQQRVSRGHLVAPTLEWESLPVLGGADRAPARPGAGLAIALVAGIGLWIGAAFALGWV